MADFRRLVELRQLNELESLILDPGGLCTRQREANQALGLLQGLSDTDRRYLAGVLFRQVSPDWPDELTGFVTKVTRHLGSAKVAARIADKLAETARYLTDPSWDLLGDAEAHIAFGNTLAPEVVAVIRRSARERYQPTDRLRAFAATLHDPVFNPGEPWADLALRELPGLGEDWAALAAHCALADTAKPSPEWQSAAVRLRDSIGADVMRAQITRWLAEVGKPRTLTLTQHGPVEQNLLFDTYNTDPLRGLIWFLVLAPPHPETTRVLGHLIETSLRKAARVGPRCPKIANVAAQALARQEDEGALAELARLATKVTYKGTLKLITAALDNRATDLGMSREDLEELSVPAFGLTEVGYGSVGFGASSGEVKISGTNVSLVWRNNSGRLVKSPPASVRQDHPAELKELKAAVKDAGKTLVALSDRLDRQFLSARTWRFDAWRERFADHPLVGTLTRRLLWCVDGTACGFAEGVLRTVDGVDVEAAAHSVVTLWHPVGRGTEEVTAWRDRLELLGVTQPFKQAHREIYPLTAAEETSATYSNRFAAHVIRQHQFHALAALRGWHNELRISADTSNAAAFRELPEWGLRAEFWVYPPEDYASDNLTSSWAFLRVGTDQVRFYPIGSTPSRSSNGACFEQHTDPVPLADVPPLVFSEVMRDVDLFVGVSSIGNDPEWREGRHREYWHSYGFGEITGTAATRRDVLTRLVPKLAIGPQCRVEGRFLYVEGSLHTYKIHLGSGNILMSPDDRYLCIVPKVGTDVVLPFEGDRMLSLILSKALLLSKDEAITDPTIKQQIS